jgi:RimJ/RimL family protein N-acetyltransferase
VVVLRPPESRLDDGVVGLRLFLPVDLPAFQAATRPGGNEGIWLIVDPDDPQRSLADAIDSWSVDGEAGHGLAIVDAGDDQLVGSMYAKVRAEGCVELSYGIAPDRRGQGLATRAARLASDWLLDTGWRRVELRIDDDNLASQRIAKNVGFHSAGRVRTWVPSAGREFEDRLFLRLARR